MEGNVLIFVQFFTCVLSASQFKTTIIDANLDQTYKEVINSTVQYIFHYKNLQDSGLRIHSQSIDAFEDHPLLVI